MCSASKLKWMMQKNAIGNEDRGVSKNPIARSCFPEITFSCSSIYQDVY